MFFRYNEEVYNSKDERIKRLPVITEYDNEANGGDESIYQVPVIRVNDLDIDTYTVKIKGVPARDYSQMGEDGKPKIKPTYLYVDGFRIYQPMADQKDVTDANYKKEESGAVFEELRNLILKGKVAAVEYKEDSTTISTGLVTWTENRNGKDYEGASFTGNKVKDIDSYLTLGPNNEVYMDGDYTDGALAFYVKENSAETHNLQIALRALDKGIFYGSGSTDVKASIVYGVKEGTEYKWEPLVTATSSTEQYYTIDYTKCPYIEGKGYQVVIKAKEGMVSYTSLKLNGLEVDAMEGGDVTALCYKDGLLVNQNTGEAVPVEQYPEFLSLCMQMRAAVNTSDITEPDNTNQNPGNTNQKPDSTTQNPSGTTQKPGSTTQKPGTTTVTKPTMKLNVPTNSWVPMKVKQKFAVKVSGLKKGDSVAKWRSSNSKVVSVSKKGELTAKKKGTAKITVTLKSGLTKTIKIKVQNKKVATERLIVQNSKKTIQLGRNKTYRLTASVTPVTSQEKITYKSSNTKCVTVSATGKIKGVKRGSATITVKSGKKTVKVKVKVK